MPNPDGTIDVRVVLYVKVDPKAWSETMMDKPTTKTSVVRDDVKGFVETLVSNQIGKESLHSPADDVPIASVWLGVGQ